MNVSLYFLSRKVFVLITVYSMTVMSRVYISVSYTRFSSILRRGGLFSRAYIRT